MYSYAGASANGVTSDPVHGRRNDQVGGSAAHPNSSRRAARPLFTRAVSTAVNESGAAQSVGLGSGIGGIGAGAPAISAGMGQATFVGVLSVPTAWDGAAPSASPPVATQFAGTSIPP